MKKSPLTFLLAALAILALSGCAGLAEQRAPMEIDRDYISAVETQARHLNTEVYWVTPPLRPRRVQNDG